MFEDTGKNLLNSQINLEGISLIDVLQIAHYLRHNSLLKIISENGVGLVLFEKGEVTHSKVEGKLSGKEAFREILSWNEYNLRNLPSDSEKLEKNIDMRFEMILLDSMRQIDEKRSNEQKEKAKIEEMRSKLEEEIQIVKHQNHFKENIISLVNEKDILSISLYDVSQKKNLSTYLKDNKIDTSIIDSYHELFYQFKNIDLNENLPSITNTIDPTNESYIYSDYLVVYKIIKDNILLITILEQGVKLIWGLRDNREVTELLIS
ncbi:MAG: DUF4388 domain-containing protein [Candidatus Sericytochromatia bacterium]